MAIDLVVILTLVGLLVFQQVYFMRQVQKLLDKLMSRSYTEYKAAEKPTQRVKVQESIFPEDMGPLSEFNRI